MYWLALLLCLVGCSLATQLGQEALLAANELPVNIHDDAANITTIQLSSITEENAYTVLTHPRFPAHQVRVKKSNFCDPTVNVYTGYLDVDYGAKHMFFYFFESRRDPQNDDVMMWINGGPGCSSATGLLMELGPCSIDMNNVSTNGTIWNPYSWNNEANIFFLDQPVGVGFSYADYGETVETTEDAARNVHAFIAIFFETFDQFAGKPIHLSGESYGGRYLPAFGSYIYDQNQIAKAAGRHTINLKSILIGNGITDISTLYAGRYAIECGTAALEVPFQTISNCVRMRRALPRCEAAMQRSCIDMFDAIDCRAAVAFCDAELSTNYHASGRNVYDISKMCLGDSLCYLEQSAIADYLNGPDIRKLLGVEIPGNFTGCSRDVGTNFNAHLDKYAVPSQYYVAGLLERGVPILIYAGTYDWQCNWVANKLWVDKLEWSGKYVYNAEDWYDWIVDGNKAGETKTSGLLTFATLRGAGHMGTADNNRHDRLGTAPVNAGTSLSGLYLIPIGTLVAPLLVTAAPISRRQASNATSTALLVMQFADVLEQMESTFYSQALAQFQTSDFVTAGFSDPEVAIQQFTSIQSDESVHDTILQSTIQSLGGEPISGCQFDFTSVLTDVETMVTTARVVENLGVAAYMGAAHLISDPVLLTAAASIMTVEARHQTILNVLNGGSAIPQAFDIPFSPSEVLAVASPFISGCDIPIAAPWIPLPCLAR
ncbi:hypothetical protein NM688_g7451 [Phlebia brevispora]|uniref:Uncharacterized protein n=1 Tax=Phlebia brevispora TaxID=194682 RepID=A0ACC1S532_9APHY|nr:hypothetical protein NM688_g7451 [Phlebia brevispora]